jgi:transcriptional regulator with XRE-family HTH domain
MVIGKRLRELHEASFHKVTSKKRQGYVSRVENGHTVPAVETLEKFARVLEVPMYRLFYDGKEPPKFLNLPRRKATEDIIWGNSGKDARMLDKFCQLFGQISRDDLRLLFYMAQKMARGRSLEEVKD